MIMSFSYLVDIGDQEFDSLAPQIREFVGRLIRLHPTLRGLRLEPQGPSQGAKMRVVLRVAGLTRWHVQRDAPKLLNIILRKAGIKTSAASFETLSTEPGRNYLQVGKGRTEMTRRPRSERMADGRPWDHIAWEGDDISSSSPDHDSP